MKIFGFLYNVKKRIIKFYEQYFTTKGVYTCILPDKIYIKKVYKKRTGKNLNLKNPQTFNEKQNWLKLYDRRSEYTMMVDKYKVREYVKDKVGEKYLVPLLGVWDSPEDIDFDSLPNEFVLKCNHDNGVIICRDKNQLDIEETKKELSYRLSRDYYKKLREWPYKNVERKIICEKFMYPAKGQNTVDYKLMCFDGKVRFVALYAERFTGNLKEDYYTSEWKHISILGKEEAGDIYEKPCFFDEMVSIAEKLSKGIPFLRVDFNIWKDMLAVGEMTFFHHGSMLPFYDEWENKMGTWIELPQKHRR